MAIAEHSIMESLAKKALLISFNEELPSPGAQSNLNHNKYLLKALQSFILVPAYGNPIDSVGLSECILEQIQSF
jgi:hypothetical protein